MMSDKVQYSPNVKLGGKIVKEKGRKSPAGDLGNDEGVQSRKNHKK